MKSVFFRKSQGNRRFMDYRIIRLGDLHNGDDDGDDEQVWF